MSNIQAVYVNHMGNDKSVVDAARISMRTNSNDFTEKQNKSLIQYLSSGQSSKDLAEDIEFLKSGNITDEEARKLLFDYKNRSTHWTPFAHTAITVLCTAPIPIRTQSFKSKQGFVENEESRRYISSKPVLFMPENFRAAATNVKQGSSGIHEDSDYWMECYEQHCGQGIEVYEQAIASGIAPEQARFFLPQGVQVNWYWTGNLYAFASFFNTRTDPHAQKEIQDLAYEIEAIIKPLYPDSWDALTKP